LSTFANAARQRGSREEYPQHEKRAFHVSVFSDGTAAGLRRFTAKVRTAAGLRRFAAKVRTTAGLRRFAAKVRTAAGLRRFAAKVRTTG
jgi:hypothetical protein